MEDSLRRQGEISESRFHTHTNPHCFSEEQSMANTLKKKKRKKLKIKKTKQELVKSFFQRKLC